MNLTAEREFTDEDLDTPFVPPTTGRLLTYGCHGTYGMYIDASTPICDLLPQLSYLISLDHPGFVGTGVGPAIPNSTGTRQAFVVFGSAPISPGGRPREIEQILIRKATRY
jgi:hypothetical protein